MINHKPFALSFHMRSFSIWIVSFVFIAMPMQVEAQKQEPVFHLDAGKGVLVNGTAVQEWLDTVTRIKAVQGNAANRPQYVAQSIGGKPALRFNGTSHFMTMPPVFPVGKDYTVVVVCKANGPSNNIVGGQSRTFWMAGATTPKMLHNGDFANQVTSSIDPGYEPCMIIAQYNHKRQRGSFYVNGVFADSAFCPPNVDSTIFISAYQGAYYFNGEISEIYVYERMLSEPERIRLQDSLFNKYDISRPALPDSSFSEIPANYQFYPRDEKNEAKITVRGKMFTSGFDSIRLDLFREQQKISSQSIPFDPASTEPLDFAFPFAIQAELANYSIEIRLIGKGGDSLVVRRHHLVCGDVYLINGQSNSIWGGSSYSNEFIRTFGKNYSSRKSDTLWTVASAQGYGGGPDIGAWGMELSRLLVNQYQIPICILNGGVGGTSIQQHQRNDVQPDEPSNIYGSLLYRARKSNLAGAAKGLFWYQGESNGSALYFEHFRALYEDWKLDYPKVEKVFVVQIHHGCGAGDHSTLREIQRRLPESFPDIEVTSAMALPGHDGCHYAQSGYLALGRQLFPRVQHHFYGGPDRADDQAPNIRKAYFSKADFSEITLLFGPEAVHLKVPEDTVINGYTIRLKDYFALDGKWKSVRSIKVHQDSLILELENPGLVNFIHYLTEIDYLDFSAVYQGPYLTSQTGVGALSFYNVPVEREIPTIAAPPFADIEDRIYLFPVPLQKGKPVYLYTELESGLEQVELSFLNLSGQLVHTQQLGSLSAGQSVHKLDIPELQTGQLIWEFKSRSVYRSGKVSF
ncbi:MAG TPA: sialate O-acetylesterase [Saprospiraceae bacterium]|nr:sialate O-acetylesterase [Saprospiraceae bacterium]